VNANSNHQNIFLLTETNFILDLSFQQAPDCERLFLLAQEHDIELVIPEYSFAEAEGNLTTTLRKRCATLEAAISVLRQADRSAYQDLARLIQELEQVKVQAFTQEQPILHARIQYLTKSASVIPFSAEIGVQAELRGLRRLAPWKPTDRNVYESMLHFVRENQSSEVRMLFLTRDRADFDVPSLHDELAALSVELLFSAGDGIRRIREIIRLDVQ
jgi:hypothetical protein